MLIPSITLFCISILCTAPFGDMMKMQHEVSFTFDSLELQPFPEVAGFKFGSTPIVVRIDTAVINQESRHLHIHGQVIDEEFNMGISSCTVAIGSLTTERGITTFTSRLQILTDEEGKFSLTISIVRNDVLLLSWTGEVYRIYRIGMLIR